MRVEGVVHSAARLQASMSLRTDRQLGGCHMPIYRGTVQQQAHSAGDKGMTHREKATFSVGTQWLLIINQNVLAEQSCACSPEDSDRSVLCYKDKRCRFTF